jgi:hypothetical protein
MNALFDYFMNCSIQELVGVLIVAAVVINVIKSIIQD